MRESLTAMISLADNNGCGIDLHIDEKDSHPAEGLKQLLKVLDDMTISIPITCSHLSSMALLRPTVLRRLADRLAFHNVNVIALPLTNSWLLGQDPFCSPSTRTIAPIKQLQRAGVTVAIGGDNVQDPWFPGGNFDPISLISFALPLTQLAPWTRLGLAPFTTAAANVMGLAWDGMLRVGGPADFLVLEGVSWPEVLASLTTRKVLVNGIWLDETDSSKRTSICFDS